MSFPTTSSAGEGKERPGRSGRKRQREEGRTRAVFWTEIIIEDEGENL